MSIEKAVQEDDNLGDKVIMATENRTQQHLSRKEFTSRIFQTKKSTYVSKIR